MKNIFTGTLAFIVYAGLCLLLFNYLFPDNFQGANERIEKQQIVEEPFIDSVPAPLDDTVQEAVVNNIVEELDSIDELELSIDPPLSNDKEEISLEETPTDALTTVEETSIEEPEAPEEKEVIVYEPQSFILKDEDGNELTNCTTFTTIYKNNPKVKIPYTCRNYGNEIKEIIANSPKAQIIINGYSSPIEDTDMGLQRAQYVEKLLRNIGINKEQITVQSAIKNINFNSGIAQGGLDITLSDIKNPTSENKTTSTSKKPVNSSQTASSPVSQSSGPYSYKRFTTGYQGDYFYGNRSFTSYISQLNTYLNSQPGKKVYVYAYTDTVGNATDNYNIGSDNVKTARRLMIQNGIPANKIVAVSKGETSSGVSGNNRGMVVIVK